jgi:hypothetical protein
LPDTALAQAPAPEAGPPLAGNLPADFYPKPVCAAPSRRKLSRPSSNEREDVLFYNRNVEKFNKESAVYNDCMQAYSTKVGNDIQGVLSTVNSAVAAATGQPPPAPPAAAGNLPLGFYPSSPCANPDRAAIGLMPPANDHAAMTAYNLKVKAFNEQAAAFTVCLKSYQDRAKRDIDQIQATSHQVITGSQ